MAIDSAAKRASVLDVFIPDGTVDQADRQTALEVYGGILASGLARGIMCIGFGIPLQADVDFGTPLQAVVSFGTPLQAVITFGEGSCQ